MKRLLVILLFAAGCGLTDEDPEPTYTDIYGRWTFEHDRVSGTFNIVKGPDGKPYVDNAGGFFTIDNSGQISIGEKYLVTTTGFDVDLLTLSEKPSGRNVYFYYSGEISSDYKSMKFTKYTYNKETEGETIDLLTNPLTVSRKKD